MLVQSSLGPIIQVSSLTGLVVLFHFSVFVWDVQCGNCVLTEKTHTTKTCEAVAEEYSEIGV